MKHPEPVESTVRDGSRYASSTEAQPPSRCLVCGNPLADVRARFCSPAHRQSLGTRGML